MSSTQTTLTSPIDIFVLEQTVLTNLNTFNSLYANYVNCTLGKSTTTTTCPSSAVSLESVTAAYNTANTSINTLNSALQSVNSGTAVSQYNSNYNTIMSQYEKMIQTRNEIDAKLRDLNNVNGSSSEFYEKQYISTAYTKILLTVLATTVAYYVFLKLRK
jgi:hypothetical protein